MRRELLAICVTLIATLPMLWFMIGSTIYSQVAQAKANCWNHSKYNTPDDFRIRHGGENLESVDVSQYFIHDYENISFDLENEPITIAGWMKESNPSSPWIILLHGIRSCKANHEVLLPAGMLAKAGLNVLMIDMRDHGNSTWEDGRVSAGQKEWRDVSGAFHWLNQSHDVPKDKIGLFGASMGAATVAITFAQEDEIQAVWLDSVFSDLGLMLEEELENQGFPTMFSGSAIFAGKIIAGEDLMKHTPIEAAKNLDNRHMYLVHGNQDPRIGVHHSQLMFDNANGENIDYWFEDSEFHFIDDGEPEIESHVSLMLTHMEEYEIKLVAFFQSALA